MSKATGNIQLKLWGPARLEYQGREIKLQRKGLAILYYLLLEGPTRREVLADLLWGHSAASQNLRVELHRLGQALAPLGFAGFQPGEDPLKPPAYLQLDRAAGPGMPMEGLEDISAEFRAWLEGQRSQLMSGSPGAMGRERLVQDVAAQIQPPFLLILMGRPGSGRTSFAQALAKTLGMPFLEGPRGSGRVLHYLRAPYPDGAVERALNDREGLWVVERSSFGEDPQIILELRSHYPPERTRCISLPPLSWGEARSGLLSQMPFAQAAKLFLASGGSPGYLRELLAMGQFDGELPLPQRVRAQVQLEARMLSLEARLALERLSVHPAPFTQGLLDALEGTPFLDELERWGWLVYNGQWQFADDSIRRVLYHSLQPGRRQQYHRQAALQMALESQTMPEAYHRLMAGDTTDWSSFVQALEDWPQYGLRAFLDMPQPEFAELTPEELSPGGEIAMLEESRFGLGFDTEGRYLRWNRTPSIVGPSGLEWATFEEPGLLHLKGYAYVENPLGIGVTGTAAPLVLTLRGEREGRVYFLKGAKPVQLDPQTTVLPLLEKLDYWFRVPQGVSVSLHSAAESALLDLEVNAYRISQAPATYEKPRVPVYDLFPSPVSGRIWR
ncbi:AfsR/SARP family transcriptional regulator [Calidithermus roseus]|uniref:Uncharacterized protein n=1 Tax=Calidithermus roseus TaxID=1644118 RepID=A0A399EIG8_9DEIN|nr:transcriptional regulator [Calidithermus roseus]RIH84497.1 hypothetical protein Mrose_02599 [Calidithermus roseus]